MTLITAGRSDLHSHTASLIHVFGTDRSGSSMLDMILGNAPDAFSCGEVSAWFRPYRKHHFHLECICGQDPCPAWEIIKGVPESVFHATLIKKHHVKYVIDSSKDICWLIDAQKWAQQARIQTHNLLIWKEPVDLAFSYWKRGGDALSWRKSFTGSYGRVIQVGLPFLSVCYNDLAKTPAVALQALCAALGMTYFTGKEKFWEGSQHLLFGSAGIRSQTQSGTARFEEMKSYPKEFEAVRDDIQQQISQDDEIQAILRALQENDVLSGIHKSANEWPYQISRRLPVWYYLKKAIRLFQRYKPQRFDETAQ